MYHSSFLLFTHPLLSYFDWRAVTSYVSMHRCYSSYRRFTLSLGLRVHLSLPSSVPAVFFRLTAELVKYPKRLSASSRYSRLTFPILFSVLSLWLFFFFCFLLCIKQSKIKYSHIGVMWQKDLEDSGHNTISHVQHLLFLYRVPLDIDQLKLIMMLVGTPGPELLMKISSESVSSQKLCKVFPLQPVFCCAVS